MINHHGASLLFIIFFSFWVSNGDMFMASDSSRFPVESDVPKFPYAHQLPLLQPPKEKYAFFFVPFTSSCSLLMLLENKSCVKQDHFSRS